MGPILAVAGLALGAGAVIVGLRARERAFTAAGAMRTTQTDLEQRLKVAGAELGAMSSVLSSMEEGVLLVDADGRTRYANASLETHLGTVPGTLEALLPLGLQEAVREAAREGATAVAEVETGWGRWLRGSAKPVGDGGSILLVVRDITEARRLDSVRRDFVTNASHELKTPVASIQAAAETIKTAAHEDPSVVPRFADRLEIEAFRLSRIVSDLLDLSRLESGADLDEEIALGTILRDEAERFERAASEAGVSLQMRIEDVPPVRGSARDLSLLVRNLVDNAIRYTRPSGRIDVALCADPEGVVVIVTDTGLGIPSRDLPRIFERFYRIDRARSRETGGTGLGLSIVKHVVENHGGTVSVRSELGRGTTFEVRLPTDV
jgi:signal transduction histidine kinase